MFNKNSLSFTNFKKKVRKEISNFVYFAVGVTVVYMMKNIWRGRKKR